MISHVQKVVMRYFFGLIATIPFLTSGQEYRQDIQNISLSGGLSQNTITDIIQDQQGFLWIGTQDGLNKYDGYEFKVFRTEEGDTSSLTNNYIKSIAMDSLGHLWLGTQIGLTRYDIQKGSFTRFLTQEDPIMMDLRWVITDVLIDSRGLWIGTEKGLLYSKSILNPQFKAYEGISEEANILQMLSDSNGMLWVVTEGGALYYLQNETFSKLPLKPWSDRNISVRCMEYFDDQLWFGTNEGLWSLNLRELDLNDWVVDGEVMKSYPNPVELFDVQSIFKSKDDKIWVGTQMEGAFVMNPKRTRFTSLSVGFKENSGFLELATVNDIYEDKYQNIWIGTLETGLFKVKQIQKNFNLIRSSSTQNTGLASNRIRGLTKQGDNLWIGTSKGLSVYDRKKNTGYTMTSQMNDPNSLSSNDLKAVTVDRFQNIWVGTNRGLNRILVETQRVQRFYAEDDGTEPLILENKIRCISSLSDGNIWVGTYGGGISVIDPENLALVAHYAHESDDSTSISSDNVMSIFEDSDGVIWASTYGGGLNRFIRDRNEWQQQASSEFPLLLSSINEDQKGNLWIGTYGNGIIKLDQDREAYSILSEKDGLSNNVTYAGIATDKHLWISTNYGINRYDFERGIFTNYNVNDGLQSNEFNTNSYLLTDDGEIFFGGVNGLTFFYPDSIKDDELIPDLAFTDFSIFNRMVKPEEVIIKGQAPLNELLRDSSEITLSPWHNVFTIDYTALDFINPEDIQYAHRLVGFERDWTYTKTDQRNATYTNLKPGYYQFEMKASNDDGVWTDKPITLFITVKPHFWETWWFRFLVGVLIFGIVATIVTKRITKVERRKRFLEAKIQEHTREISDQNRLLKQSSDRLQNLNHKKDQMFYLLAHNVRAPLTTLKALFNHYKSVNSSQSDDMDQFMEGLDQNVSESIQLLDNTFYWSKLQFEDLYLTKDKLILSDLVNTAVSHYTKELQDKSLTINQKVDQIPLINDRKMMLVILQNLISNAIKYSFPNSTITIESQVDEVGIRLSIIDFGVGMTEEELNNVFDENRNINRIGTKKEKGTGLGLLLSYKLAQKLGCELKVKSHTSLTKFTLVIPNLNLN